jgi:hypothetical protein
LDIVINSTEETFVSFCAETIINTKQTIEKSLCDGIIRVLLENLKNLDFFVNISHDHNGASDDKYLSLKEYIKQGYASILSPKIIIECKIVNPSMDFTIVFPEYIRPGQREYHYPRNFKADQRLSVSDKKALKTKPKYIFFKSEIRIETDTLIKLYDRIPDMDVFLPSKLSVWEWRQTFYDIKNGEAFFCTCFKKALQEKDDRTERNVHPHIFYALQNKSFKDNICSLCTKEPSELYYCHEMYGSKVKVKYGAYIQKIMLENKTAEKEAENIVRKMVGYPLIGEGWVSETALYKRIKAAFPKIEILHHGRPKFLGRQEYDIWIPKYKIAIEYQGVQHHKVVEHWGGEEGLAKRKELDKKKLEVSKENDVILVHVEEGYDFPKLLEKLRTIIESRFK